MFKPVIVYNIICSLTVCCQLLVVVTAGADFSAKASSVPAQNLTAADATRERKSSSSPLETLRYSLPRTSRQSRQVAHEEPAPLHRDWKPSHFGSLSRFEVASDSPRRARQLQLRSTGPRSRTASSDRLGPDKRSVTATAEDGEGVDIYLFDTGIAYEMAEFEGRAKFVGRDFVNPGGDGRDDHGHGTYTASLAVGRTVGAAKKATIYSVKVLNKHKNGNSDAILQGLAYVERLYLSNTTRRAVVLLPMVSPYHRPTNELVERLVRSGLVVVTSAGNDADDACKYTPGSARGVINTGAVDERDAIWQYSVRWSFAFFYMRGSNYGSCVDLFAPGTNIYGSSLNPALEYIKLSGTSATAPQTAGVVAAILQAFPTLTPGEVKARIIAYSTKDAVDLRKVPPALRSLTPNRLLATPKHMNAPADKDTETDNDKSDSVTKLYAPVNTPTTATLPNPTAVVSTATRAYKTIHTSALDTQEGQGGGDATTATGPTRLTTSTTFEQDTTYADAGPSTSHSVWPTASRVLHRHTKQSSIAGVTGGKTSSLTQAKSQMTVETKYSSEPIHTSPAFHIRSTSSSGTATQPESTTVLGKSEGHIHTSTGKDRTIGSSSDAAARREQLEKEKMSNSHLPAGTLRPGLSVPLSSSSNQGSISVLPALYRQQVAQGQTEIAIPSVCAIRAAYEEMKRKEYMITYIHPTTKSNGTCFSVVFTKAKPKSITSYRAHFNLHYHELESLVASRQVHLGNVTAMLGYTGEGGSRLYLLTSESRAERDLVLRGFLQSDYNKLSTIVRQQGYWMVTILWTSDKVSSSGVTQLVPTTTAVYRSFRCRKQALYFRNIRAELIKPHIKFMWKKGYHISYISTYTLPHQKTSLFLVGFATGGSTSEHALATVKRDEHSSSRKLQPYLDRGLHMETFTPFVSGAGRKLAYLVTLTRES